MTLETNPESGLIKPPAHLAQEQQQKAARTGKIGELKHWLEGEHEKALAENPVCTFKTKLPLDTLKALTPEEADHIHDFEEQAFARLRRSAADVDHQRRLWIAGGGSEESFEDHWGLLGEYEHNSARAAEVERATRASSPY